MVAVLTDSADPKQYIKRMKSRDESLKANWGTICTLVPLVSEDGKKHKEITADTQGIFRLIQSIPSPKAEPFKPKSVISVMMITTLVFVQMSLRFEGAMRFHCNRKTERQITKRKFVCA